VNGAGGRPLNGFSSTPEPGSVVRYSANHGAMLIEANPDSMVLSFFSVESGGTLIDRYVTTDVPFIMPENVIVASGSVWKYLDNNSDQGTAWRAAGFNDNAWPSGPVKLGFGGDGEVTVISGGPSGNRHITTYFRRAFAVSDPSLYNDLRLEVIRDDGAVVYLNGTEVWRTNMPPGSITNATFASTTVAEGPDENTFYTTALPLASLVMGTNVLAAEIHQSIPTSSDLGFDLRLIGVASGPPLPIQLASFTALAVGRARVRLDWTTLTERNNYGFEVQRAQASPSSYHTLPNSFVPGHGTTLEPHSYSYIDATALPGILYYRLRQIDLDGTIHYSDGIRVDLAMSAGGADVPAEFALEQNYPNPSNPATRIRFSIPDAGTRGGKVGVSLRVWNLLGIEVATLVNGQLEPGSYEVTLNADNLASGMYLYQLKAGNFVATRRLIVLR
ncbi:MAG: T9SS type A sorting domain-containing protein, partial [Bacteroidota bacterium]